MFYSTLTISDIFYRCLLHRHGTKSRKSMGESLASIRWAKTSKKRRKPKGALAKPQETMRFSFVMPSSSCKTTKENTSKTHGDVSPRCRARGGPETSFPPCPARFNKKVQQIPCLLCISAGFLTFFIGVCCTGTVPNRASSWGKASALFGMQKHLKNAENRKVPSQNHEKT